MKWFSIKKKNNKITVDKRNSALRRISFLSALIFIVSLLVFNILFDTLLGEHLRWDWSEGQLYTTGEVTDKLLEDMDQNVQITGLFEQGSDANLVRVERMLDDYVAKSNGKIEVRYVNMDVDPTISLDLDPTGIQEFDPETIVVKNMDTGRLRTIVYQELFLIDTDVYYETGSVIITGMSAEYAISGAIQYVTAEYTPTVYTLLGHSEDDIANYTQLTSIMRNYNSVDLGTINLSLNSSIPEDCELILMMDPKQDITPDEKEVIMDYLENGGDLMVVTEYNTTSFPKLNEILAEYNIGITDNRVREENTDYRYNQQEYFFVIEAPAGSIMTTSSQQLLTINPRALEVLNKQRDWVNTEVLLQTSESAVAEIDGDPDDVTPADVIPVAISCENTGWTSSVVEESSKVVVVASKEMLSDAILLYQNTHNDEMFFYSVNWLTDVEDTQLFISDKVLPSYLLQEGTQTGYIFAAATGLVIIPGVLLLVGLVVYRRRKNL